MPEQDIAVLISGAPRLFYKYLWSFLQSLPPRFHFFFSFPTHNSKDKYLNRSFDPTNVINCDRTKVLIFEDASTEDNDLTQREKNTIHQWHRLYNLIKHVPSSYEKIVRIRPDIRFECDVSQFVDIITRDISEDCIFIPNCNNIYDLSAVSVDELDRCINDQVAFGRRHVMEYYCNMYSSLSYSSPIISEKQLYAYLTPFNIIRFDISYSLVLSNCFIISLCGDSGAGKTTVSKLITDMLPSEKTMLFETDRYHKWERGNEKYLEYTHLHPEANNLESLTKDIYTLSVGNNIYTMDYDHSTGKFIYNNLVVPADYMIVCGLHTLYAPQLRNISDIKIYIDTEQTLKEYWKITRDTKYRGATIEHVRKTIERRFSDFKEFIEPQRSHADMIIEYYPIIHGNYDNIGAKITLRYTLAVSVINLLTCVSSSTEISSDNITFTLSDTSSSRENFMRSIREYLPHTEPVSIKEGLDGIIQYCILVLIWNY